MFVQAGVRRNDSRSEESEEELSEGDVMQVLLTVTYNGAVSSYVINSIDKAKTNLFFTRRRRLPLTY